MSRSRRPSRSRPSRSRASRSRPSHDGFAVRALGALLLSAALAGLGCGGGDAAPPVDEGEPTHQSFDRGVLCTPERLLRPETVEEVQAAVRWAAERNLRVKAVSSAASHSENAIICADEGAIQLSLVAMDAIVGIDEEAMQITVEPAAQMGAIGDALHEAGLGVRNTIPLRDLTAAGAIATGAHHTSLRFPSGVHDMVVGLSLVDGRGELQRLEGEEARGAAAHLGRLGVVVAVTFQAEPQFKTRHAITSGSDEGLEDRILAMAREHDYASFSWWPGEGRWVLRQHDIVPADTPGEAYSVGWVSTAGDQRLQAALAHRANRDPEGEGTLCDVQALRAEATELVHEEAGEPVEGQAVGFSHRMFSSTCEGLACPWEHLKIFNPEVAIPVEELPRWMRRVREIVAARPACFPLNGLVIRFSAASESWLGMNAGQDVAYVELHVVRHPDEGAFEHFADVHDELHQMSLLEFEARPHWGKNYGATFLGLDYPALYPEWERFEALRARLDPDGRFENAFFRRALGLEPAPRPPGCAVERDCFCRDDADCGPGLVCRPGAVVEAARVCRPE
ncbi:MAG TPA: D-arabinono-1,4-lactone oxidase [Polyangiaceae bacterium LLY-WYZ-15_(1-7)]|nr:D-arabinono-1,4-lactone oxidase [Polyangiaceae bacterium LLY-WYZ-15_(1-7)]HJL04644.1 D-arabinono-1,4-lactone oxidase [Polyangiaceae bacterium LLY-WYZ-15_(1-7)]HJL07426.1 D-arabinono-1,4-lactone oxidase [Polyangiaceae bacterium LLY-WYZ-15_(1-7)]HJL22192.1 D-arabinono-1,4-lactone oxidase [Polyangiaceae bacterium LLY-WYZ-15_(1-7)]HJL29430.1 D-arabinono-1,4-lactone oxidase [Polyangiaceae bacterium LLY-WYZ-15_(1-7)]